MSEQKPKVQMLPRYIGDYVEEPNDPKREAAVDEIMRRRGFVIGGKKK